MTTDARALIRRQLDLEEEAYSLGAIRYRQARPLPWRTPEDNPAVDEEANLPPGQQLIKLAVEPTAALIREKVEAAREGAAGRRFAALKWLEEIAPEEVAYLAARVAVNFAIRGSTLQTAAIELARAIIDHVEMSLFAKKNKAGYNGLIRSTYGQTRGSRKRRDALKKLLSKEGAKLEISQSEKLHLGSFALETLVEATDFFTIELEPFRRGDKAYTIRATEAVEKWLERQHARCELLEPMWMPMVVRPRRWRSPTVGGYLSSTSGRIVRQLVKPPGKLLGDGHSLNRTYLAELRELDLSKVYEGVNHVQETAWAINAGVFKVVREVWDSGGTIAGLPPRDDLPMPPKPLDMETNPEAMAKWKREAAIVHSDNAKNRSLRLGIQQRLWMAERFSQEEAFWFPHSMDFRGRLYPIPGATGFSPQSDDLGKALLKFHEGKPLGEAGAYWLAVHIANLFGVDKVSFKERVEWTYAHSREIIDSAVQPLDGERFWLMADSPWMALAAAQEFVGYLEQGPDFVSHIPIPLDGSNSGLQHFSAMLRDPVGGAAVNLLPADKPQDVYDRVATKAHAIVSNDEDPMAAVWVGKINRKIAKRPTMTFVYSATRFGMHEMILDTLRGLDAERAERGEGPYLDGEDNYSAAMYLSHILFGAIGEVVSAAQGAMDWLRAVAKIAADAGHSLQWTTPDGLLVRQSYRLLHANRVRVHWQGRQIKVTLGAVSSALDGRAQANAVAPNFVHSLDAAHLRAVARAARTAGIDSLAVIHDSFGTHAADTDTLVGLLRDTFVEQYDDDILVRFYEEAKAQLPEPWSEQVPPPPEKGSLDLSMVKYAPYLFA